jgi:hypothetical protein
MTHHPKFWHRLTRLLPILLGVLAAGGLLLGAQPISAGTITGDVCMQTLFGTRLNCTANDVSIAAATSVSPSTCQEGQTFDLTATFQVNTTATQRYDIGLYFATDGDPNSDGAKTGDCALTTLGTTGAGDENYDGDFCGDTSSALSPRFVTVTLPDVLCADPDNDGFLNLPNCVSWRNNSGDLCSTEADAFPGTKAKCKCDIGFSVPVTVEPASATLTKNPTQAVVTYEVNVANTSVGRDVSLTALCDDTYGTVAGSGCPAGSSSTTVSSTTCVVPLTLFGTGHAGAHDSTCSFDVVVAAPGSSSAVTDIVTGTLVDTGNNSTVSPQGSATVTVDLPQTP